MKRADAQKECSIIGRQVKCNISIVLRTMAEKLRPGCFKNFKNPHIIFFHNFKQAPASSVIFEKILSQKTIRLIQSTLANTLSNFGMYSSPRILWKPRELQLAASSLTVNNDTTAGPFSTRNSFFKMAGMYIYHATIVCPLGESITVHTLYQLIDCLVVLVAKF